MILNKRYNNYDLLRCICLLGVFFLHTQKDNAFHKCLACFGTMSVPCFFMMSGALTLKTDKAIEFKGWVKKTFHKLIIPWILALLLYLVEGFGFQLLHTGQIDFVIEARSLAKFGYPTRGWHLWYMYTFTEIYLLVPFLIMLKRRNRIIFYMTGAALFLRPFVFEISLPWYLTFLNYLWFYILGDFIYSYCSNLNRAIRYILTGIFCLLIAARFYNIYMDFFSGQKIEFIEYVDIMSLAMILWMVIFSNLRVKFSTYALTRYFFPIYILHIFVGDFWSGILRILHLDAINTWWIIFVDCFVIFIGCYVLCILGQYVQRKVILAAEKGKK